MKKIIFIIPSFQIGGAEKQLVILSNYLSNNGFIVNIFYRKRGPLLTKLNKDIKTVQLFDLRSLNPILFFQIYFKIKKINPDFVQTYLTQMDILGGIASIFLKKKTIVTERSSSKFYKKSIITYLRKTIAKKAVVLSNSISGCKYWISNGMEKNKVYYIPNSIRINCNDDNKSYNFQVVVVCRLIKLKSVDVVLKALAHLNNPKINLVIVGDGPEMHDLVDLSKFLNINEKITFTGYSNDVELILRNSQIFISMSMIEGMPNVALEAASSKCALILSDISQHKDIFINNSAIFCQVGDYHLLSKKIKYLFENHEQLNTFSQKAFQLSKLYSEDKILPKYIEFYKTI